MAVNDTRSEVRGEVTVSDVESGKHVFQGRFHIPRNGKALVTTLPEPHGQGVYLIRYAVGGRTYGNHFLYGKPPYVLSDYLGWMEKSRVYGQ